MWHVEFAQGETLSFRSIQFSFAQLHQLMRGQWQKCYGSAFMRYLFILFIVNIIPILNAFNRL